MLNIYFDLFIQLLFSFQRLTSFIRLNIDRNRSNLANRLGFEANLIHTIDQNSILSKFEGEGEGTEGLKWKNYQFSSSF